MALIGRARHAASAAYRVTAYQQGSLRQHRAILAALRAGDRDRAADLLFEHHLSRADQLASYLEREVPARAGDGLGG
jgi:DNA-binding GntR family transcriptional regulator